MLGWPLGEYAAGEENPTWMFAYVGGGLMGAGVGMAIWSGSVFDDAVDAHNTSLGAEPEAKLDWRGTSFVFSW